MWLCKKSNIKRNESKASSNIQIIFLFFQSWWRSQEINRITICRSAALLLNIVLKSYIVRLNITLFRHCIDSNTLYLAHGGDKRKMLLVCFTFCDVNCRKKISKHPKPQNELNGENLFILKKRKWNIFAWYIKSIIASLPAKCIIKIMNNYIYAVLSRARYFICTAWSINPS